MTSPTQMALGTAMPCPVNSRVPIPMRGHSLPAPMGSSPALSSRITHHYIPSHLCSSKDFLLVLH